MRRDMYSLYSNLDLNYKLVQSSEERKTDTTIKTRAKEKQGTVNTSEGLIGSGLPYLLIEGPVSSSRIQKCRQSFIGETRT